MRTGLISLCLLLSLTACQTKGLILPPESLLMDCPKTPMEVQVNGDLVRKIELRDRDIDNCNADKSALRTWVKDVKSKAPKRVAERP